MSRLSSVSHQLGPETTSLVLYLLGPPVESSKSLLWFRQLQSATQAASQKTEKRLFFRLYSPRSCSTQVTAGDMFLSILVRLAGTQGTIINVLLHPRGFYCCSLFILRIDTTTAKWDTSLLILSHRRDNFVLIVTGFRLASCFQSGLIERAS